MSVATSTCSLVVELVDLRSWIDRERGRAYVPLGRVLVAAGESTTFDIEGVSRLPFHVVATVPESVNPSSSSTLASAVWEFARTGADPVGTSLAVGIFLLAGISALVGLVLLVRLTGWSEVGAFLAVLVAVSFAVAPYTYHGEIGSSTSIWISGMILSPLLVGLAMYFLVQRPLKRNSVYRKLAWTLLIYFVVGIVALLIATPLTGFSGVPWVLLPFWPMGLSFMIFSEQLHDHSILVAIEWLSRGIVMAGVSAILLYWLYRRKAATRTDLTVSG